MARRLSVLLVEDSVGDAELCVRELKQAGFDPTSTRVWTAAGLQAALQGESWDVVLSDYQMPTFDGMAALETLRRSGREIPFVFVTGTLSEETAVECLKRGADDYVLKENLKRLGPAVDNAIQKYVDRRERQALEQQLRHAQRLETVGTLAGGVAHDINNVLTAIFGHLDLARSTIHSPEEVNAHLDAIHAAANRASGVARGLLTFSRRTASERRTFCVNEVCRETARLVKRLIPAAVSQEWQIPDERLIVDGDETQIQQVLMNLVINARDAMPKGGCLSVTLSRRVGSGGSDQADEDSQYLALEVSDTGIGMSAEVRQRCLEPFYTTKPRGEGTGLGLAIVHGIVFNHGGSVDVVSEVGVGTRFTISLPCVDKAIDVDPGGEGDSLPSIDGMTVLVLEDDPLVRAVMASGLRGAGCRVLQAGDGYEALRLLRQDAISVAVIDLQLPGMPGTMFHKQLREASPSAAAVFVSGQPDDPQRDRVASLGVPLLSKPFPMRELIRAVWRVASENVATKT